jgi:hypothetical protein
LTRAEKSFLFSSSAAGANIEFNHRSIERCTIFVKEATPLLNTPHFRKVFGGADGHSLLLDPRGLLLPVELVALPGTPLTYLNDETDGIVAVRLDSYPIYPLYVDRRSLTDVKPNIPPHPEPWIDQLLKKVGTPYIWGGNWSAGIPSLLERYPPSEELTPEVKAKWTLQGVDCSGLLYEVTGGKTPRNTSQLLSFGEGVARKGACPLELSKTLQPLDLIVWKGHVVIALGDGLCIESSESKGGVILSHARARLEEVCHELTPSTEWEANHFVIRRWNS